jgi:hypothetical protein
MIGVLLNESPFIYFLNIINHSLTYIINIIDVNEREIMKERLISLIDTLILKIIQIEIIISTQNQHQQVNLETNQEQNQQVNLETNQEQNQTVNLETNQEQNQQVNLETNTFEDFIETLNDRYPLRCKGLENNDDVDDRIESDVCNICLESLNYNQLYRTIRCSHTFHPQCIDRWLFQSSHCPICREAS